MQNSEFIIRPLVSAEISKVRALHASLLPIAYPTSFFLQLTLLPARVCMVAYHPENPIEPIAFASAALRQTPRISGVDNSHVLSGGDQKSFNPTLSKQLHHIEILTLGVLPAYQQRGVARLLVRRVYEYFREHSSQAPDLDLSDGTLIHTNVATSNVPALSFYQRIGMRIASGVIRNLYRACPQGSKDGYLLVGRISS
ncbi:putative acetyltransferase (GNAT) family protein [Lyophyllum shimeji]|uniref:N-alpha-acetyltransferase 60 n=1 Tax=Lyophyllum shimeji TaxID=47721 RepID=A0A9P3PJE2_LYOSH|nr:putative acetyltransferase (GNAT) family protein [Lyophyllum shimeji]